MNTLLETHDFILMEAAVIERLRREFNIRLHPLLLNAPLVYNQQSREVLARIYNEYIDIAAQASVPMLLCAPTWRANRDRVMQPGDDGAIVPDSINEDAVAFIKDIRLKRGAFSTHIYIGGLLGCQNDCYRPEEGLSSKDAESFHSWQIARLSAAGADFLMAETLPCVSEAVGIARAMNQYATPYFIGFVIGRDGALPDGTRLWDAVQKVDASTAHPPLGYVVNCAYPTFLCAQNQPPLLFSRLVGYMGNGSSLDHCELENATRLQMDAISDWGEQMLTLNRNYGIKVLGGCCGTSGAHLKYLCDKGTGHHHQRSPSGRVR